VAKFYMSVGKGRFVSVSPPLDVVRDILAVDINEHARRAGLADFPTLDAVTAIPVIRPDGSIISATGYDPATRLYYAPAANLNMPPVSQSPTPDDVRKAVGWINEAIGEVPSETDADHANAIGTLITPAIRQAIDGKSPLAVVDAPQAGTGKSLFAEVLGSIVTGEFPAMMGAPADDAEWRKQITATLLTGPTVIVIDNVEGTLTSPSLSRVLTANSWSDRILGFSQQVTLNQRATWIATGNNVQIGGDLPRRCYRIRLDAKTARPWRGRSFRHPELHQWVAENRGRLVWAILTLCGGWYAARCPSANTPIIGSFESWSKAVGGILQFAGIRGFLGNVEQLYEDADDGSAEWEAFLRVWHSRFGGDGVSVAEIVDELQADTGSALRDALPDILGGFVVLQPASFAQSARFTIKDCGKFKIRLGKQLKQRLGRRYGEDGLHLGKTDDTHSKVAVWQVHFAGSAGNRGGVPNPTRCADSDLTEIPEGDLTEYTPATTRTPRNGELFTTDGNDAARFGLPDVAQDGGNP
jgi:hypothetical protein